MTPAELMKAPAGLYEHTGSGAPYYVYVMRPGIVWFLGTRGTYRGAFHVDGWNKNEQFNPVPLVGYTVNFDGAKFLSVTVTGRTFLYAEIVKPGVYQSTDGNVRLVVLACTLIKHGFWINLYGHIHPFNNLASGYLRGRYTRIGDVTTLAALVNLLEVK